MKKSQALRMRTFLLALALVLSLSMPALATEAAPVETVTTETAAADPISLPLMIDSQVLDTNAEFVGGVIYLPFRLVFTGLGAEIGYDAKTRTASAVRGDTTVAYVLGTTAVTITRGEARQVLELDSAALNQSGSLYLPTPVAEAAFNVSAYFSPSDNGLVLLDLPRLMGEYEGQFTIFKKLLSLQTQTKGAVKGLMALDASFQAEGMDTPMKITATAEGLSNQEAGSVTVDMTLDLSGLPVPSAEELATLGQMGIEYPIATIKAEVIVNLAEGKYYMRSPVFSALLAAQAELPVTGSFWLGLDVNALAAALPFDLGTLSSPADTSQILTSILTAYANSGAVPATELYASCRTLLDSMVSMIGDKSFEKKDNTYTAYLLLPVDEASALDMTMTVTVDEAEQALAATLVADYIGALGTVAMDIAISPTAATIVFDLSIEGVSMRMSIDGTYEASDETPISAPAQTELVVDITEMIMGGIPALPAA